MQKRTKANRVAVNIAHLDQPVSAVVFELVVTVTMCVTLQSVCCGMTLDGSSSTFRAKSDS